MFGKRDWAVLAIACFLISTVLTGPDVKAEAPCFQQTDIFVAKGRAHFRIPSMVVARDGTVLAFCNRRMDTVGDNAAEVHVVVRRSVDEGKTWRPMEDVLAAEGWTAGIGSAVVDAADGTILLFYGRHPVSTTTKAQAGKEGFETGRFLARSTDNGATWTHQKLVITANKAGAVGGTHGSGTGITLKLGRKRGRLLVPARYHTSPHRVNDWTKKGIEFLQTYHFNCAIYSDDHGKTWKTSEPVQPGTGEGCLAETSDGTIYYNSRAYFFDGKRRIARSDDGGATFGDFAVEETLIEPIQGCNAALIRYPKERASGRSVMLFSNPAHFPAARSNLTSWPGDRGLGRIRMTIRLSYDEGKTWPISRVVNEGPSGYSSLAVSSDGTILCLYETGKDVYNEKIAIARFNLEWLTGGNAD